MTTEELKSWRLAQKIQIMEVLWDDFRDRFERAEPSQRIKDLLDQRGAKVRDGAARILDWDARQASIGRA